MVSKWLVNILNLLTSIMNNISVDVETDSNK